MLRLRWYCFLGIFARNHCGDVIKIQIFKSSVDCHEAAEALAILKAVNLACLEE